MFFFDAARFGTHSKIGRAWLEKGKRSPMLVKLGFKNFYLYSAVEPKPGIDFTLQISHVNTICLNVYLVELSKAFPNDEIMLVMDGAGWHKSKSLKIPQNIELVYLPPYSPELNPVERLWQYVKQHTIKNKVYVGLSALSNAVDQFLKSLTHPVLTSLCSAHYVYN